MTGQALAVQGDALHLPLPDASVDLCVTSPPFWALRAYGAGPGEIGREPSPQLFLEALWAATAEMMRVLKPSGSMFVNLGDKYSSAAGPKAGTKSAQLIAGGGGQAWPTVPRGQKVEGAREKSLLLLPERYRIGCVDQTNPYYREQYTRQLLNDLMDGETTPEQARADLAAFDASPKSKGLGLIARSVIIWDKPNGLPEFVTDRVRRSHEDWVHLVKQPRYYSALDEVREPNRPDVVGRNRGNGSIYEGRKTVEAGWTQHYEPNPLGKPPGSVWSVPSEPLRLPEHLGVQHYAAFPSEWPRRLILGFSPPGICLDCGQGRVPVVEREQPEVRPDKATKRLRAANGAITGGTARSTLTDDKTPRMATILGYACSCTPYTDHPGSGEVTVGHHDLGRMDGYPNVGQGWEPSTTSKGGLGDRPKVGPWREYHLAGWKAAPTRPAVVLDPFAGTGTTPMVARALDRIGVGVDLSHAYCRAARWRVKHDGAKAISRTNLERQGMLL